MGDAKPLGVLFFELLDEGALGACEGSATNRFGDGLDFLVAEGAARRVLVGRERNGVLCNAGVGLHLSTSISLTG